MSKPENIILKCPFCEKESINAIYIPPTSQTSVSRAAGRTATRYYQTKEKYEILSGCKECGKSQKQVEKALSEGKDIAEKEKKVMERLKKAGMLIGEIKSRV